MCLLLMLIFGSMHLFLVLTNQTSIEFAGNSDERWEAWTKWQAWKSRYDVGFVSNFQVVFGPSRILWPWPFIAASPQGDGLLFAQAAPPGCPWFPWMSRCCPPWAVCLRCCSRVRRHDPAI